MRRWVPILGVAAALLASCASGSVGTSSPEAEQPTNVQDLNDIEREFFDFMIEVSATEEEATCVSLELARLTRTNS